MISGYQEARERAAFDERADRGRVRLTGADTKSFLHALLTNDIESLAPGTGCYAALLTPQGRMITDMAVLIGPGDASAPAATSALLAVPSDVAGPLAARFDESIFTEDVAVADVTAETAHFSVVGPESAQVIDRVLSALGHPAVSSRLAQPYQNEVMTGAAGDTYVWRSDDLALDGCDIVVPSQQRERLRASLAQQAAALSPSARTALRLEAGRPEFHVDMTEETIPLEANLLDRAISTTKGCYVGQEIIIRVLHRGGGRVAKRLVRLRVEGLSDAVPRAGDTLLEDTREVGRITSAAWSPREEAQIALGYVHRDFAREGVALSLENGRRAVVTAV